jgi:DNA-binding HxlR family transcriptional regulator
LYTGQIINMLQQPVQIKPSREVCHAAIGGIRDTLYVLGGKWKLPIIAALTDGGPIRFRELQKSLVDITPKVLSKELKELELNEFVTRTVYDTSPVTVEYELTEYSRSLSKVLQEMRDWGIQHRQRIKDNSRKGRTASR